LPAQRFQVIRKVRSCRSPREKREQALSTTTDAAAQLALRPIQRIGWSILILLTLYLCYFSHLGVIGLLGPDEPRYAWIARDMAETGDWVTPRLYGKPWFEKPPLLYWGGAIFFDLFGARAPEVAARLPSAISALLATLALAWLAWRTYGEECARWLLLLLPTSVGMIGFSHAAATDMPFAGMLTITMVCAAVVLRLTRRISGLALTDPDIRNADTPILPRTPWLALLLFGFFVALAVLAKGPAAIILCGGAVFFWAIFTKRWRDALRLLHPAAIAAFCATALPWYILCARRNPEFFRIFIIEHNFKRYLTPEFQHVQPFWFYIPILLIALLPWVAIALWASYAGFRQRKQPAALSTFLLCWSLFCVAFFSVSKSKLPGYILPAVPAVALLLARGVQAFGPVQQKSLRTCAALGTLLFGILSALFFELGRLTAHHSLVNGKTGAALGLLALFFSMSNLPLVLVNWSKSPRASRESLAALPVLGAMLCAPFLVNAPFPWDRSGKTIATELRSLGIGSEELFLGPMDRGQQFSLNFYLRKETLNWDRSNPKTGYLLLRGAYCAALVPSPYVCSERPVYLEKSGKFLYQVTVPDSLPRSGSGRQPGQEK
jgi:4-amino-4-deoxy-L-arabinose transferase-like glycosyltransferase